MDYTSVKIPKTLTKIFDNTIEANTYRSFSEFVMESVRIRLVQLTKQENS